MARGVTPHGPCTPWPTFSLFVARTPCRRDDGVLGTQGSAGANSEGAVQLAGRTAAELALGTRERGRCLWSWAAGCPRPAGSWHEDQSGDSLGAHRCTDTPAVGQGSRSRLTRVPGEGLGLTLALHPQPAAGWGPFSGRPTQLASRCAGLPCQLTAVGEWGASNSRKLCSDFWRPEVQHQGVHRLPSSRDLSLACRWLPSAVLTRSPLCARSVCVHTSSLMRVRVGWTTPNGPV